MEIRVENLEKRSSRRWPEVIGRLLAVLAIAVLGPELALAGTAGDGKSAGGKTADVRLTQDEMLMLSCVNAERREKGLPLLAVDPVLVVVARQHSADMATRGFFSHVTPAPLRGTPVDRYAAALGRRPRTVVGENLGGCDSPMMGLIHAGMMASREHRANILDREYVSVGVGVYAMPDGRVWVTQMFRGELPRAAEAPSRESSQTR
jgi:uncharacterized protein YkwD